MSVACGTQATLLRAWTTSTPWLSFGLMQSHISTVKTSFLNSTWSLACLVRAWVSNLNKEIKVLNWGIRTDQQDDCPLSTVFQGGRKCPAAFLRPCVTWTSMSCGYRASGTECHTESAKFHYCFFVCSPSSLLKAPMPALIPSLPRAPYLFLPIRLISVLSVD